MPMYSNSRNSVLNCLREELKEKMNIDEKSYDRKKMTIECNSMGNLGVKEFHHIYCRLCMERVFPEVLTLFKFDPSSTITDVIDKWDKKKITTTYLDIAGCFLPREEHVYAGPNSRRFIKRPQLHDLHDRKGSEKKTTSAASTSTTTTVTTSSTTTTTRNSEENTTISSTKGGNIVLNTISVGENGDRVYLGKKTRDSAKFSHVGHLLDPKIAMTEKCNDKADSWSKEFMLKVRSYSCFLWVIFMLGKYFLRNGM